MGDNIDPRIDALLPASIILSLLRGRSDDTFFDGVSPSLLLLGRIFLARGVFSSGHKSRSASIISSTFFSGSPAMNVAVKTTRLSSDENKANGANSLPSLLNETSSGVLRQ